MYMVTLAWEPGHVHRDVTLVGFRVLIDGEQLGGQLEPTIRQTVIDNLHPGTLKQLLLLLLFFFVINFLSLR